MWSKEEVIIERIYLDRSFFEDLMSRVENFFMHSVLPELIGKWLTRKPISDEKGVVRKQLQIPASEARKSMVVEEDPEALWCYCRKLMIPTTAALQNPYNLLDQSYGVYITLHRTTSY